MNRLIQLLAGLLSLWLALWRMVGDRWGWLGMLNAWAEWGIATLALFALRAGWRRQWTQCMALLGFVAIGTEHYRVTHRLSGPQPVEGTTFSIFSANLYKSNPSAVEHIALIRQYQPDVICLQELTPHLAEEFLSALDQTYPFKAWHPEAGAYGYGVLSRFRVEQTGEWETPGIRPWGQRVSVNLAPLTGADDETIEVYNVHLVAPTSSSTLEQGMTWGFRVREQQMRLMQEEIKARGYPACIIGDHNFTPSSDLYQMTQETLRDSWLTAGQGTRWTWPTRGFPLKRLSWVPRLLCLDYCFHNQRLTTQAMHVLTERTGSDHCPLLVTFTVD